MSTYELLLAIHIVAAVIWAGGAFALQVIGRLARKSGDPRKMLEFTDYAGWIGPRVYAPASLVLLVAGILLVGETPYEHSDLWVTIGYAGWTISFLTGILYFSRAEKKQAAIVADQGAGSPEFLALYRQVALVSAIDVLIVFAVVADMAIKPGA